jgi:hypothetical protein
MAHRTTLNGNSFKHFLTMTKCSNFESSISVNLYEIEAKAGDYACGVGEDITKIGAN